jgi:hypothetical protein
MSLLFAKLGLDKVGQGVPKDAAFYAIDRASNGLLGRALYDGFFERSLKQDGFLIIRPRLARFSVILLQSQGERTFKWTLAKELGLKATEYFITEEFSKAEIERGKEIFPSLNVWRVGQDERIYF